MKRDRLLYDYDHINKRNAKKYSLEITSKRKLDLEID